MMLYTTSHVILQRLTTSSTAVHTSIITQDTSSKEMPTKSPCQYYMRMVQWL